MVARTNTVYFYQSNLQKMHNVISVKDKYLAKYSYGDCN